MNVGQLIKILQRLSPDMPVVTRNKGNPPDDFVEIKKSDIVELKTKEVFKNPFWGTQLYDASEGVRERSTRVLSLSGGTNFQRGSDEPQD